MLIDLEERELQQLFLLLMKTPSLPLSVEIAHALAMKIGRQMQQGNEGKPSVKKKDNHDISLKPQIGS